MVASTSADPSSSRHNDTAFAVARSGIGNDPRVSNSLRIDREEKPSFRWRRRSAPGAGVPARARPAWRCAIARACARGAAFIALDHFDDPRAIRWNVRVVGSSAARGLPFAWRYSPPGRRRPLWRPERFAEDSRRTGRRIRRWRSSRRPSGTRPGMRSQWRFAKRRVDLSTDPPSNSLTTENMAIRALEAAAARHVVGVALLALGIAHQEQVDVIRLKRGIERGRQMLPRTHGPHEMRRDDDDEIGLALLEVGGSKERAEDGHVAQATEAD